MTEVYSQARVDYCFLRGIDRPLEYRTAFSNTVSTVITDQILSVVRSVNKEKAEAYEILTYTVVIKNMTRMPISNISFQEEPSSFLLYVPGSVTVNKQPNQTANPLEGFSIELPSLCTATVTLSAVVLPAAAEQISNRVILKFSFASNHLLTSVPLELLSNETVTSVEHSLFKECHISNTIKLPEISSLAPRVTDVNASIQFIQSKSVRTAVKQLQKKPGIPVVLLLCDLMVHYEISYEFINPYMMCLHTGSSHQINISYMFRESLFVPNGIEYLTDYTPSVQLTAISCETFGTDFFCDISILLSL